MKRPAASKIFSYIGIPVFILSIWIIHNLLAQYHLHDIVDHLHDYSSLTIGTAVTLTVASYLFLGLYDVLALRYINRSLDIKSTMLTSFISYVFSNNVGLSVLGGTSVRLRLYSVFEFSTVEIGKIVVFCTLTFWLGLFIAAGAILFTVRIPLPPGLHLAGYLQYLIAVFAATIAISWCMLITLRSSRTARFKSWEFTLPSMRLTAAQIMVSVSDLAFSAGVLYVLLPVDERIGFVSFMGIYLVALFIGSISHVPGGLGVFEAVIIHCLAANAAPPSLLGALLIYRTVYYLIPMMAATTLLGWHEWQSDHRHLKQAVTAIRKSLETVAPLILSFAAFFAGVTLLWSGAVPETGSKIRFLIRILPLPILEASHFLNSIVGMGLLIVARGIRRRLNAAFYVTVLLLVLGIGLSLTKGGDIIEASILTGVLIIFWPSRSAFCRKTSLLDQPFTVEWIVSVVLVISCTLWLGLFSYRHVQYSSELWWRFSLYGDAPRFLRMTVGIFSVTLILGVFRLFRPGGKQPALPDEQTMIEVTRLAASSTRCSASLALLGDKSILFNELKTAFIMYGIEGSSWIVMGDPVGPELEWPALLWDYRELCDLHGGRPAFYQTDAEHLPYYLDLGMSAQKIGEEAYVDLQSFTLEGGDRAEFRQARRKMERDGCTFEILPLSDTSLILPRLRKISDSWLQDKNAAEKKFSLGYFDEGYLKNFRIATAKKNGEIVAFVNVLTTADKNKLSCDLMRYTADAPKGVMDFIFVELILWGKSEGYAWFSLGMAPLAGLEKHNLAPLWNRLGNTIFRYGEHFYNFEGLRSYKNKFSPVWRPKYLASRGGLSLPQILIDLTSLIGGGITGIIKK